MQTDIQNPEKKTEEQKGLTNDELKQVIAGKIPLDNLPVEKQNEFHQRFVLAEEELPEDVRPPEESGTDDSQGTKAENQEEPEQKEPGKQPEKAPEEKKSPDPDLKRKYYEKSNELNTTKQRLESVTKRLKDLENLRIKAPDGKKDDDLYSEENLKAQREEVAELRRVLTSLTQGEVSHIKSERERLQQQAAKLEEQNLYLDIQSFQGESPELKTEKPFHVLNAAYAKFQNDVGGPEARERYFSDQEFRKQKEAEGITLPMDEKTWEKYKTLVELHHFRKSEGYPNYSSAYYIWKKNRGIEDDQIKQAALKASQAASAQIVENKTETKTLSPNDGTSGEGGTGMTEQQMIAWLEAHPFPKTKDEQAMQQRILSYVSSATSGE